ncbi:50S ribosomal protein L1 [Pelagibacterales bacterium]|jgi:large subunit ribosomal protein L1|nr:50S ribosomal protein L1 [Pelagibacterales bacterium]MDB9955559.1 50S ribosomal protein L1 [Pelagibacterales bacterium]|tara:strand:- start:915 stop:1598 length:684 start_codon:yes stop_codon:yes gene_type:complete
MKKRITKIYSEFDKAKFYSLEDGVDIAMKSSTAKFNETIDIAINVNVDPKKGEQNVRGKIQLPKSLGKVIKVCVFANADKQEEAKEAGADLVGGDELVEKVKAGFTDFDRCISTPDMMAKVGKLGQVLGPRGLMPNPKLGTVTANVKKAVEDAKAGELEYKTNGIVIHSGVGKSKFNKAELVSNIKFFVETISKDRPAGIKGDFIKGVSISPTMGPGIKLDLGSLSI